MAIFWFAVSPWGVLVAHMVKHPPAIRETQVRSLGWEDLLEKEMATHCSIPAWWIPGTVGYSPWGRKESDTTERLHFMKRPLIKLLHLSNLLQMPHNHRIVNNEFMGNFSCIFKRISLDDGSQLVTVNFWWSATELLIFKALVSKFCKTSWTTTELYISLQFLGYMHCW